MIISLLSMFVAKAYSCDQNRALYLTLCSDYSAIVSSTGYTFPEMTITTFEENVMYFRNVAMDSRFQQSNDYIVLYNGTGLNRMMLKHLIERVNAISGFGYFKVGSSKLSSPSSLILTKHGTNWIVYKITDKFETDDWCGVDWQYEYYEKINYFVIDNDRLNKSIIYEGPLYIALSVFFNDIPEIGENAFKFSNINYICNAYESNPLLKDIDQILRQ